MSDARTETLRAELESALRKRTRLDAVIDYLRDELGIQGPDPDGPDPGAGEKASAAPQLNPNAPVTTLVAEGEFFGMSGPKAAVALLERVGRSRPLKTDELFEAIVKGGVKVKDRQGFYRTLFRDPRFLKVGRSLWGLAAWYPESARKAAKADQEDEACELGLGVDDESTPAPVNPQVTGDSEVA